jgi:hypothetical protein
VLMAKRKGLAVKGLLAKRSSIDLSPAIKAPKRKPAIVSSSLAKLRGKASKIVR